MPAPDFYDALIADISLWNCVFSVCSFLVMSSFRNVQSTKLDKSDLIVSKLALLMFLILYCLHLMFQTDGCSFSNSIKYSVLVLVHSRGLVGGGERVIGAGAERDIRPL